ncbi:hypothetical protein [Mucilaginibacter phyllosphaerae]
MTIALTKLKGIIYTYSNYKFDGLSPDEIEDLKLEVEEIAHSLIWKIAEEFKRQEQPQIVRQVQSELTFFAEAAFNFPKDKYLVSLTPNVSFFILEQIVRVLNHLRTYYPAEFNFEALLPTHYTDVISDRSADEIQQIMDALKRHDVEDSFIAVLKAYLSATGISERFQIKTWRQLVFQEKVYKGLKCLLHCNQKEMTLEILKLMVALEFNSIQIYGCFVRCLEKITLSDQGFSEQMEQLSFLTKTFRQVRIEARDLYDPNAPSLKDSVIESISAEIAYIQQKENIYQQNFRSVNPESSSKFYFTVGLTLAELMFFFRVALDVKFVMTKFNAYLYEFVSNHIKTEHAENLSKQSMRNHINNKPFPDKVVRVVRAWLAKMIEHIDLYYKY